MSTAVRALQRCRAKDDSEGLAIDHGRIQDGQVGAFRNRVVLVADVAFQLPEIDVAVLRHVAVPAGIGVGCEDHAQVRSVGHLERLDAQDVRPIRKFVDRGGPFSLVESIDILELARLQGDRLGRLD